MCRFVKIGGFKPIYELSATNGGSAQPYRKRIPDEWSYNVETPPRTDC